MKSKLSDGCIFLNKCPTKRCLAKQKQKTKQKNKNKKIIHNLDILIPKSVKDFDMPTRKMMSS